MGDVNYLDPGQIIDAPTEPQRRVAKEIFNAAAAKLGIKGYQVQSTIWFFEQQLFNHLGAGSVSLSFSDGARKFDGRNAGGNAGTGGGQRANAGATGQAAAGTPVSGPGVKPSEKRSELVSIFNGLERGRGLALIRAQQRVEAHPMGETLKHIDNQSYDILDCSTSPPRRCSTRPFTRSCTRRGSAPLEADASWPIARHQHELNQCEQPMKQVVELCRVGDRRLVSLEVPDLKVVAERGKCAGFGL